MANEDAFDDKICYRGTGRRKTSVARVRLLRGKGDIKVNEREFKEFFTTERCRNVVVAPLKLAKALNRLDVFATVSGGGMYGQADAMVLGIARALLRYDKEIEVLLKKEGFLTRDARRRERKKYGQRGARARYQYSKR